jgi:hypothetical protein
LSVREPASPILIINAKILTMDPANARAEAMLPRDGRIGDIEAVSLEEIHAIRPAAVICGGKVTFEA